MRELLQKSRAYKELRTVDASYPEMVARELRNLQGRSLVEVAMDIKVRYPKLKVFSNATIIEGGSHAL